jgi:hypothetical protein
MATVGGEDAEGATRAAQMDFLWEQYQRELEQQRELEAQSVEIFPEPAFVVKSLVTEVVADLAAAAAAKAVASKAVLDAVRVGHKIFVNVCYSDAIAEPSEQKGEDGEARLRIPLSCSEPALGKDKEGRECVVFDVVFNTQAVLNSRKDLQMRDTLAAFALDNVAKKFGVVASPELKFPQLRYKGTAPRPPSHRIRKSGAVQRKLVSEISPAGQPEPDAEPEAEQEPAPPRGGEAEGEAKTAQQDAKETATGSRAAKEEREEALEAGAPQVAATLFAVSSDGTREALQGDLRNAAALAVPPSATSLVLSLPLPEARSVADVDVTATSTELTVIGVGASCAGLYLRVVWPQPVRDDRVRASFSKKRRVLEVDAPLARPEPLLLKNGLVFKLCV